MAQVLWNSEYTRIYRDMKVYKAKCSGFYVIYVYIYIYIPYNIHTQINIQSTQITFNVFEFVMQIAYSMWYVNISRDDCKDKVAFKSFLKNVDELWLSIVEAIRLGI